MLSHNRSKSKPNNHHFASSSFLLLVCLFSVQMVLGRIVAGASPSHSQLPLRLLASALPRFLSTSSFPSSSSSSSSSSLRSTQHISICQRRVASSASYSHSALSLLSAPSSFARTFATESSSKEQQQNDLQVVNQNPQVVIEDRTGTDGTEEGWKSQAIRGVSVGRHRNMDTSPRKLGEICRMIRGLSVEEALRQLAICNWQKGRLVAKCIRTAAKNAVHNFNMDHDRLIVATATGTCVCRRRKHASFSRLFDCVL